MFYARAKALFKAERAELLRTTRDTSWMPAGFKKFALNPYLAYKKDSFSRCDNYGTCFPFELVSNKFCSSIYIAGNFFNKNDVVSDSSSDTARGISPGTRVKMKLQFSTAEGGYVEFTDANCQ